MPVNGVKTCYFGAPDGVGGSDKGLSIVTRLRRRWRLRAMAGWFAGPFRSYGQLLIINAGGGYYLLLAGMERINVSLGQFVLAGEPVAVMGDGSKATAAGEGQSSRCSI